MVGEGVTEVNFADVLLEKALGCPLATLGARVTDAGGHESALGLLEALAKGGLRFGGFADDEGKHPTRWQRLSEALGPLLFRWKAGCIEQNVIGAVPDDKLEMLIADPNEDIKTGRRLRTLADRLGIAEKDFPSIKAKAGAGLKALMIEAAMGTVPEEAEKNVFKAHAQTWFKTPEGGRELAVKMFSLGLWPALKSELMPFCNAVRKALGMSELPDLHRDRRIRPCRLALGCSTSGPHHPNRAVAFCHEH
jgi:putative ATP-dependent endonuclease of OLD family